MLDGWLGINRDGSITVFTGKIELGQGILTALSQIVADELDVDLKRIRVVSGDTSRTPNEGVTAGSLSLQDSGTALRFACAEAREMLMQAAASADDSLSNTGSPSPGGTPAITQETTPPQVSPTARSSSMTLIILTDAVSSGHRTMLLSTDS